MKNLLNFLLVPSGVPTNISLLQTSSTSLTFSWEEVVLEDQNGNITSYECILYELFSDSTNTVSSDTTMTTITDLSPHKGYIFQVAAVNAAGRGPFSNTIMTMTDEAGMFRWHVCLL